VSAQGRRERSGALDKLATGKREFRHPRRQAGPLNHLGDQVDPDHQLSMKNSLSLHVVCQWGGRHEAGPPRALPTEAKVESGTSQSKKSGTSVNLSNSGNLVKAPRVQSVSDTSS
jgi:hypothetical protein